MTNPPPEPGTPAGWYPHPEMAQTQRYWDGETWTGQVAPLSTPTPEGAEVAKLQRQLLRFLSYAVPVALFILAIVALNQIQG